MNKKFKLTDKVTKESIRSPEFKRWLMRILAVVCILSLIFQFSTCVYQGFSAYAVEDDSIVGTWILNEIPLGHSQTLVLSCNGYFYARASYGDTLIKVSFNEIIVGTSNAYNIFYISNEGMHSYYQSTYYQRSMSKWRSSYTSGGNGNIYTPTNQDDILLLRTVEFIEDVQNVEFKTWLRANAVKQAPPIVHDFTNEIRVFNDELTFFITDQASWVDVFYFDYEILGLGVCDYLSLQRTTSNQYLMGYNVVSDGADGYLHTSYRYYVAQSRGGFLRENYKTIRFISNPEDTNLQQWLLDNTTLIGTVDDQETYDQIYDMGFNVGYNSGYEQGFANSLIGDSLSGPINALSSITLIQIGDTVITLGGVIMTAIALCLVLAFLKLYAGG